MHVHLRTSRLILRQFTPAEGSRALIDKGFTDHGLDRVVAETLVVNLASRRVLEKCGLTLLRTFHPGDDPHPVDGAEQGHVEYQLTRSGWEATRHPGLPALHAGLGLGGFFEAYAISAVLRCRKPDPRMYRHACPAVNRVAERAA